MATIFLLVLFVSAAISSLIVRPTIDVSRIRVTDITDNTKGRFSVDSIIIETTPSSSDMIATVDDVTVEVGEATVRDMQSDNTYQVHASKPLNIESNRYAIPLQISGKMPLQRKMITGRVVLRISARTKEVGFVSQYATKEFEIGFSN